MRKTIFAILAAAAMVACSNDELVNADREAIAFDNAFVDNATRSVVDPSFTNTKIFADFAVYGFVENAILFNEKPVTGSGTEETSNATWTYSGTQYWIEGAKYNFAAVAPYTNRAWTLSSFAINETKLSFTNNGTQDLLYSFSGEKVGAAQGNNSKVGFTFSHALAKVKFSFENKYIADNTLIRVHSIKINNAYTKGDVTLTYDATTQTAAAAWSNQNTTDKLLFGNAAEASESALETIDHNAVAESYHERLLIPGAAVDGYEVEFTYDILVAGQLIKSFTKTVTVDNFAPEAGNAYDLKAVIKSGDEIQFTVNKVNTWVENPEQTIYPAN